MAYTIEAPADSRPPLCIWSDEDKTGGFFMGDRQQRTTRRTSRNRAVRIGVLSALAVFLLVGLSGLLIVLSERLDQEPEESAVSEQAMLPGDKTVPETTKASTTTTHALASALPTREIPVVLQNPELPTGCESTAAAMLLYAYGYDVDKTEFAQALPKGALETYEGRRYAPHPDKAFTGDPFTPYGYGVFSGIVSQIMQSFIDQADGAYRARNLAGADEETLCAYVERGIPVCVWTTMSLRPLVDTGGWYIKDGDTYTDEYFSWPGNEHCVLLVDCDADTVTVHDPLKGKVDYDLDTFFQRYQDVGQYAVVLEPQ